jgi:hypothetical protein
MYNIDGCDASYTTKYNLLWHLRAHHDVTVELGKLRCPSIRKQGPRVQVHTLMNARVLNNPLAQFHCNEQKVIARAKRHTFLEWDRLQVDLQYAPKVPKPALVKLAFSHIRRLLGMTALGVGAMPLNV